MNKKEVLEIRKQFSPDNCAITRICGCYVDCIWRILTAGFAEQNGRNAKLNGRITFDY